jgi:hypothetical protein
MAKIVVIDTGVDRAAFPDIDGCAIVPADGGGYTVSDDFQDRLGHGTAVCGIIRKNCAAEIFMVRIFDGSFYAEPERLLYALEYAHGILKTDIVSISAGIQVTSEPDRLEAHIDHLVAKGVLVVSAFDNAGSLSLPAAFKSVIGIDASEGIRKLSEYLFVEGSDINIIGALVSFRVAGLDGKNTISKGRSFTTAYMVSVIAQHVDELRREGGMVEYPQVMARLKQGSVNTLSFPVIDSRASRKRVYRPAILDDIHRVVAFPFSKEMHALAAFEELLICDNIEYYDVRQSGKVGARVKSLLPHTESEKVIRNIDALDWDSDFDLFVCGHLDVVNSTMRENMTQRIIDLCTKHNKRLYMFDYLNRTEPNIFAPAIDASVISAANLGKLWLPHTPILAVFGTTRVQGKHTLQLKLRKLFQQAGYKVGQIGTEPSGYLFGFDSVYPMGYNPAVQLAGKAAVAAVNELVRDCDAMNYDIIITGSQASTITYANTHIDICATPQYEYLVGIWPDYAVLCVNVNDEMRVIERNVKLIEGATNCKVGACVISHNRTKMGDTREVYDRQSKELASAIMDRLGLESYPIIDDASVEAVFNKAVNFFANA